MHQGGVEGGVLLQPSLENQAQILWVEGACGGSGNSCVWTEMMLPVGTRLPCQYGSGAGPREASFPGTELSPGGRTAPGMALGLLHGLL